MVLNKDGTRGLGRARRPLAASAAALGLMLGGCSGPAQPTLGADQPVAIATTTQLGSIVGDIASCAGATSETLMPVGSDPHEFALASNQVARLAKAKLVVANGLGLEAGMQTTLTNLAADTHNIYEVAPNLDPIPFTAHGSDDGDDHGGYDPHVFLDVARMATAAQNIGTELTKATGDEAFTRCGAEEATKLKKLDDEVRQTLATIPAERRILVTDHDAFGYFAKAYDFTIAGVAVPGGSTDAESSSAQIAAVVAVVKETKVPAIFSNSAVNPAVVEAIAAEAGQVAVVPLFVESVGKPGSGAETYSGMMMANAKAIAEALS